MARLACPTGCGGFIAMDDGPNPACDTCGERVLVMTSGPSIPQPEFMRRHWEEVEAEEAAREEGD